MITKQNISKADILKLENAVNKSINNCTLVFGDNAFKDMSKQGKQSMVYFYLLMPSLGELTDVQIKNKKENIKQAFIELFNSDEFQKTLSGSLQNKSSIIKRKSIWNKTLLKHLK